MPQFSHLAWAGQSVWDPVFGGHLGFRSSLYYNNLNSMSLYDLASGSLSDPIPTFHPSTWPTLACWGSLNRSSIFPFQGLGPRSSLAGNGSLPSCRLAPSLCLVLCANVTSLHNSSQSTLSKVALLPHYIPHTALFFLLYVLFICHPLQKGGSTKMGLCFAH